MPRIAGYLLLLIGVLAGNTGCGLKDKDPVNRVAPAGPPGASARLTLLAERTDDARTYRFFAEIVGGPDDDSSLYCKATTWDYGDAPALSVTPSCAPWSPGTKIPRRFETSHAYESQGKYQLSFSYGPLTASRIIEVP
jgi:hypothetical protein